MKHRQGNDPTRRIAPQSSLQTGDLARLAHQLVYVGSAPHKTRPGDYGFQPPVNPRPWKSTCDSSRIILKDEARSLFRAGIELGILSLPQVDGKPKYVWAVDAAGEVYEAKIGQAGYHGYRLEDADSMKRLVLTEWNARCQANS